MDNSETSGQFDRNDEQCKETTESSLNNSIHSSTFTNCSITQHITEIRNIAQSDEKDSTTETTKNESKKKQSVINVRQPIFSFEMTQAYSRIHEDLKGSNTVILHCHGFSGVGKSETVRKLANNFPFFELEQQDQQEQQGQQGQQQQQKYCVKWHIECDDKSQDIKEELKKLVAQTRKYLGFPQHHQDVLSDIENDKANSFVQALINSHIPVLLIIEMNKFKTKQHQQFVRDLLRSIEKENKSQTNSTKLHVYLTSQSKSAFLKEEETSEMTCYRVENLTGFNELEGMKFLLNEKKVNKSERECALKVYKFFSGSPLGLGVAKNVCKKDMIKYSDYWQMIQDEEGDSFAKEDEETDENELKMFKAITMPFRSDKEEANQSTSLELQVLYSLSYFHHIRIPRCLIERCLKVLRNKYPINRLQNKRESGQLISKLHDYGMCSIEEDKVEDKEYVTFHELILHAFRIPQQTFPEEKKTYLLNAVEVMAGILGKDLRRKKFFEKMRSLLRHALEFIDHLEKQKNIPNDDDHLMKATIVHLYETVSSITMSNKDYKHMSDTYFKKAIELMWKNKKYSLTDSCNSDDDLNEVAEYVMTQCDLEGSKLQNSFITNFESKIMLIPGYHQLKTLQKDSENDEMFQKVQKAKMSGDSKQHIISLLRECGGIYLDEESHKKIFLVERLASILHSWSRVILYKERDNSIPDRYYLWMSTLSNALSVKCREKYGIALLTEETSSTTGRIPIIRRMKSGATPELLKAKEFCENALKPEYERPNNKLYEHGLLRPVFASDYKIQMQQNLIQIYTKLFKSCPELKEANTAKGKKLCNKLLETSRPMWLIRYAKFYAGCGDFDLAFNCFTVYFDKVKSKKVSAWVIYNYARAVVCGNRISELPNAITKVRNILKTDEVIANDLNQKLKTKLEELEKMNQPTTTSQPSTPN